MLLDGDYENRPATPKNRGIKFVALFIGLLATALFLITSLLAGGGWMKFAFWWGNRG
ncbi:MAG: hypothetical protein HYX22_00235 [Candidatus Yanofskybacteria bacterium]|nr:hypothetical protein [Candidatus Yanofskybacteria bacterium]